MTSQTPSQLDNDIKAARVKDAMLDAVQQGSWCWKAPVGYVHVRSGGRTMLPDPQRAPLVRQAFELVASGLHTRAQVHELVTARGLTSPRGNPLSRSRFDGMLRNPLYISRIIVPKWSIDTRGNFPPLVTEEIFWRVQAYFAAEGHLVTPYQRRREEFPLRGSLHCSSCGSSLTASWAKGKKGTRYPYYHCPSKARCDSKPIRAEVVEQQFLDLLSALRPQPDYLALFRAIVLDTWKARQQEVSSRRADLETQATALKRRREVLEETFVFEKRIDQETYDRLRVKLLDDLTRTEIHLAEARSSEVDVEAALEFAIHLVTHADTLWIQASLDQRQRLQRVLFPEGLEVESGRVQTPATSTFFSYLGSVSDAPSCLVSPTGFEPVLPP